MPKSLIRKNQLHPDISDLVNEYGTPLFVTSGDFINQINILQNSFPTNLVYATGNQTINGIKTFGTRPLVNGVGVLLQGEAVQNAVYTTGNQTINGVKSFTSLPNVNGIPLSTGVGGGSEFTFPSNLTVSLTPGKTFGRYQNGDTIEAVGLTTSQVIQLAITEKINPTVNLSLTPTQVLLGQTNISNTLNRSYTINNAGASISSASLEWNRGNDSSWTVLNTSTAQTSFTHPFTNTSSNSNSINYQYRVVDSQNTTGIATANVSFLYGNYFGYNAATSLTTVNQIESLGNLFLSDSRSRTINNVTAGAGLYLYYAYKSEAGDLTSIIQDGAAPVLGAFTKQSDVPGTNLNGVSVTYRVYRSNATQAFTNNSLAFS